MSSDKPKTAADAPAMARIEPLVVKCGTYGEVHATIGVNGVPMIAAIPQKTWPFVPMMRAEAVALRDWLCRALAVTHPRTPNPEPCTHKSRTALPDRPGEAVCDRCGETVETK